MLHRLILTNTFSKKNINSNYKITNKTALNELLAAISDEDSRILPLQIDQNTLIEKMRMNSTSLDIIGVITSENFTQFAKASGQQKIQKLLTEGMIENCDQIFPNEFQRNNPYIADITLNTQTSNYQIHLKSSQCTFK